MKEIRELAEKALERLWREGSGPPPTTGEVTLARFALAVLDALDGGAVTVASLRADVERRIKERK